jgi:hypothetical protein
MSGAEAIIEFEFTGKEMFVKFNGDLGAPPADLWAIVF